MHVSKSMGSIKLVPCMNKSFTILLVRNGFSLLLILLERDQSPVDDIYILHHKQRSVPSLRLRQLLSPLRITSVQFISVLSRTILLFVTM